MQLPAFTLVLGGISSGKSAFAESLVASTNLAKVYIATAQANDEEMVAKIARHEQARAGAGWKTIEAPHDPAAALAQLGPGEVALLDCVTFWLTNIMLEDSAGEEDWHDALEEMQDMLAEARGPVVAVSNDVAGGVIPDNAMARRFQQIQGEANQKLAAQADLVVMVTAGLPQVLKGDLPAGEIDSPK